MPPEFRRNVLLNLPLQISPDQLLAPQGVVSRLRLYFRGGRESHESHVPETHRIGSSPDVLSRLS
jgi:hypothetical protein